MHYGRLVWNWIAEIKFGLTIRDQTLAIKIGLSDKSGVRLWYLNESLAPFCTNEVLTLWARCPAKAGQVYTENPRIDTIAGRTHKLISRRPAIAVWAAEPIMRQLWTQAAALDAYAGM